MSKKTISYISGEGLSGSTLLDIVLGSRKNSFSAGELIFLPLKGIKNAEYCACGNPASECSLWSGIIQEWNNKRVLNLDEYIQLQKQLTSKKNIFSSYKMLKYPSGKIELFLNDTRMLYNIIFEHTNSNNIIDSSKSPGNILILKHLGFDLTIIHLTRRFGDVLNSYKTQAKKDLKIGREADVVPRKTSKVIIGYILKNILVFIFSKINNLEYKIIKYEDYVLNPILHLTKLVNYDDESKQILEQRGPFYPEHLVAGNKIRMNDQLYISEKPMNTSYHRLNRVDKLLARCVDFFY